MMHDHLDRTRRETVAVRSQVDKAKRVLEGLGSLTVPEKEGKLFEDQEKDHDVKTESGKDREKDTWGASDALLAG